ncbi:MAG: chlorophyll synthase ChlG [Pseudomonadota bacterium]
MDRARATIGPTAGFSLSGYIELTKPITWFPPMWAFGCGLVGSGAALSERLFFIAGGIALAGPLVCGTSQIVNDWYDRDVDAINEPDRPIPSGRVPGRGAYYFALLWTAMSLLLAAVLGPWILAAAIVGLALAWAYSAPPFRLKRNGWWGNAAVGLCYEGLPWFTATSVAVAGFPGWPTVALALAYSIGAHGIMTLNDFKALDGDRRCGIRSLPVQLGPERAARLACWVMAVPQVVVIGLLLAWGAPIHAGVVALILVAQIALMVRLLTDPRRLAPWYNATGIVLYVSGMMVAAFALRTGAGL